MLLPAGVTRVGRDTSANKGPALSGSNMPCSKAMDEILGCTAQLLKWGIPWNQGSLPASLDPYARSSPEAATGPTAFCMLGTHSSPGSKNQDSETSNDLDHLAPMLQSHQQEDGRGQQGAEGRAEGAQETLDVP